MAVFGVEIACRLLSAGSSKLGGTRRPLQRNGLYPPQITQRVGNRP